MNAEMFLRFPDGSEEYVSGVHVPRIGETVRWAGSEYTVTDVAHTFVSPRRTKIDINLEWKDAP